MKRVPKKFLKIYLQLWKIDLKMDIKHVIFYIIRIKSRNMRILIIGINNILKFTIWRCILLLFFIYVDKYHGMFNWSCFHPQSLNLYKIKWLVKIESCPISKWLLKQVNRQKSLIIGSCRFFDVIKLMWTLKNILSTPMICLWLGCNYCSN
jgi:hypothetical protein